MGQSYTSNFEAITIKNHFMGIIGSVVGGLAGIGGAIGAGIAGRKAYKKIWGY